MDSIAEDVHERLWLAALVSVIREHLGVSDARTIADAKRCRERRPPMRPIGARSREGRPRAPDVELFDEVKDLIERRDETGDTIVSVASLVRRVYSHLPNAPVEWANGKRAQAASARSFETFARAEEDRIKKQRRTRDQSRRVKFLDGNARVSSPRI